MVLADLDSKDFITFFFFLCEEMLLTLFTAVALLDPIGWLVLLWGTKISV